MTMLGLARATLIAVAAGLAAPAPATLAPKLYVYDHCPFCVRVRLALGLKGVRYDCRFMANDEVDLPTSLVGKKIAPIWDDGVKAPFAESLDIIAAVDADAAYGPTGLIKPASGRSDLKAWQKTVQEPLRKLQRPRYVKTFLPEFCFKSAKDAFVKNHALPPYEKPDWKALPKAQQWALYEACFDETADLVAEVNGKLKDLEPLIHCEKCATEGGLSIDDIDLWARLRSLTLIKGIEYPTKIREYLDYFAEAGDCPLYDPIAL